MTNDQAPAPAQSSRKILVVDDDALVAMSLVTMLEDLGHTVLEANSGEQALAILHDDSQVALVITDQGMPGLSGTDLARQVSAFRPDLPVLLATGYHEVPEGDELRLPRLAKPYDDDAVARTVTKALASY